MRLTFSCLVLGLAITSFSFAQAPTTPPGTASTAPTVSPTAQAATVNGEVIYEVAVQRALDRVPPDKRTEARPKIIDYLADNLLIDQSLRAAGYKADETEVTKRVGDMKAELKKIGRDFDKMLAELKVSEKELREHIAADLRWFKYASSQATDKALSEMFAKEKDMFDGTAVRARHILITPSTPDDKGLQEAMVKITEIKKAIEAEVAAGLAKLPQTADKLAREKARGELLVEVFAKYAKDKSDCPTKANGGDVGFFQKAGFMVQPFANASFALQVNQMSEVVRTPFGLHLIVVTERRPGKEVKFEDVKDVVKEVYFDRLHDYLAAQLRQKAKIVVNPAPK
ncbi:MAG: peptidylprolyl isomerase [Gemmataceae bacterium]